MLKQGNNMDTDREFEQKVTDLIKKIVPQYLSSSAFTDRKVTDTPLDKNSVVPRGYITNNGTLRPTSSVIGQPFFDTSLASGRGKLITWNGTGWVGGDGNYT